MALESGIVYEGEKTGMALGLFTINSALHSVAANADVPWLATGAWLAAGAEAPKSGMKAEVVPKGIETTDAPPRLTKSGTASSAAPAKAPARDQLHPLRHLRPRPPQHPRAPRRRVQAHLPRRLRPPPVRPLLRLASPQPEEKKDDKTGNQKKSAQNDAPPAALQPVLLRHKGRHEGRYESAKIAAWQAGRPDARLRRAGLRETKIREGFRFKQRR